MKHVQRVVWSEGMLVSPQHFQQQDYYHESLLEERLRALWPSAWGVLELSMDSNALGENLVSIKLLRAILPSGQLLELVEGSPETPKARGVPATFASTATSLDVYLALPAEKQSGRNFSGSDGVERPRYGLQARSINDAVAGGETQLHFAIRNFSIVFGSDDRTDLELLRIARLGRNTDGGLCYLDSHIPPALRMRTSRALQDGLERVLSATIAKQRSLASERSVRDGSAVEYNAADITRFLLLNALNTFIPMLRHYSESDDAVPYDVYRLLLQYGGQLCSFSANDDPAGFPPYLHNDLKETFEPLFLKLLQLLQATVAGQSIRIPLDARGDGVHLARLTDEKLQRDGVRFVLSVSQTEIPENQAAQQIPRLAKVGSWAQIAGFVNSSMPGAQLRAEARPPKEISLRPNHTYFVVEHESGPWKDVLRERTLAVHLPPPYVPQKVRLELHAVPKP
jgi:type VI secretion system protein ImpJ